MTRSLKVVIIGFLAFCVFSETGFSQSEGFMTSMPAGVSISGKIEATIDGRTHHAVDFADGLVFALSSDTQQILGFSYTTNQRFNNGHFRIDGLPNHGDIILFAFKERVKRFYWMDLISLDELALQGLDHQSIYLGTVQANMSLPRGAATDLSSGGEVLLKGKTLALQALVFAGWIAFRSYETAHRNYQFIDELTKRLYDYYTFYIKSTDSMVEKDFVRFNHVYRSESGITKRFFLDDTEHILAQHMDGKPNAYSFGLMRLERYSDNENLFLARFQSGHGGNTMRYHFGIAGNDTYYVDFIPDSADSATRLFATDTETNLCSAEDAAKVAARHFHYCQLNLSDYKPYKTIDINTSGRQAFIFGSCAGPETRGRASFVIIERTSSCTVLGEYPMTYDMYPEFQLHIASVKPRIISNTPYHNTFYGDIIVTTEEYSEKHTTVLRYDSQRGRYVRGN